MDQPDSSDNTDSATHKKTVVDDRVDYDKLDGIDDADDLAEVDSTDRIDDILEAVDATPSSNPHTTPTDADTSTISRLAPNLLIIFTLPVALLLSALATIHLSPYFGAAILFIGFICNLALLKHHLSQNVGF